MTRNIRITDKQDRAIEQAEGTFKWWLLAFLAMAWVCRNDLPIEAPQNAAQDVNVLKALGLI